MQYRSKEFSTFLLLIEFLLKLYGKTSTHGKWSTYMNTEDEYFSIMFFVNRVLKLIAKVENVDILSGMNTFTFVFYFVKKKCTSC